MIWGDLMELSLEIIDDYLIQNIRLYENCDYINIIREILIQIILELELPIYDDIIDYSIHYYY